MCVFVCSCMMCGVTGMEGGLDFTGLLTGHRHKPVMVSSFLWLKIQLSLSEVSYHLRLVGLVGRLGSLNKEIEHFWS